MKNHEYTTLLQWTADQDIGTESYRSYSRNYKITAEEKQHTIMGSSDPAFLGDPSRYNPEELFLSSLSSCHMLWYLHLCSINQVVVTEYLDNATGVIKEDETGSGAFTEVILHPKIRVKDANMKDKANELHKEANKMCFIANSCNFKIDHDPTILVC